MVRVRYNNPGLVVDLGVGLWAWPMPMDYDGDGDFDLVVSCPDVPFNGMYLFENPQGNDLAGTYFNQGDYAISDVTVSPAGCTVTVTSSADSGPPGTGTLSAAGVWSVSD